MIDACDIYLELRFSSSVRSIASFMFVMDEIFFLPIILYVPSIAFNQVTGVNIYVISGIICVVCVIYTLIVSIGVCVCIQVDIINYNWFFYVHKSMCTLDWFKKSNFWFSKSLVNYFRDSEKKRLSKAQLIVIFYI
ncbi:sodium-coupled monocarboxylate transporter 1-like [Rhagoletis pomonella]|uniref:sodium-coupled monocarboxylate transporter 1-like n=1 Tax=Rhagoletis pomonella TaxID=28610 RepID=UPI001785CDC8|nr:sodium-coupled monocarboxylate transporter 1-like [Rhagoletis pomonella]